MLYILDLFWSIRIVYSHKYKVNTKETKGEHALEYTAQTLDWGIVVCDFAALT